MNQKIIIYVIFIMSYIFQEKKSPHLSIPPFSKNLFANQDAYRASARGDMFHLNAV